VGVELDTHFGSLGMFEFPKKIGRSKRQIRSKFCLTPKSPPAQQSAKTSGLYKLV